MTLVGTTTLLRPDFLKADCPIALTDLHIITRHNSEALPTYLELLIIKILYTIKLHFGYKSTFKSRSSYVGITIDCNAVADWSKLKGMDLKEVGRNTSRRE